MQKALQQLQVALVHAAFNISLALTNQAIDLIIQVCGKAESLNEIKLHILQYVKSRMTFIAPIGTSGWLHSSCQTNGYC